MTSRHVRVEQGFGRARVERRLTVERVQRHSFEQIAERHRVKVRERLEDSENPSLESNTCLHPLNGPGWHAGLSTLVHMYRATRRD